MAMYKAKQQGRNAYAWFSHDINEVANERVSLRNDLQESSTTKALNCIISRCLTGMGESTAWKHCCAGRTLLKVIFPPALFLRRLLGKLCRLANGCCSGPVRICSSCSAAGWGAAGRGEFAFAVPP